MLQHFLLLSITQTGLGGIRLDKPKQISGIKIRSIELVFYSESKNFSNEDYLSQPNVHNFSYLKPQHCLLEARCFSHRSIQGSIVLIPLAVRIILTISRLVACIDKSHWVLLQIDRSPSSLPITVEVIFLDPFFSIKYGCTVLFFRLPFRVKPLSTYFPSFVISKFDCLCLKTRLQMSKKSHLIFFLRSCSGD